MLNAADCTAGTADALLAAEPLIAALELFG